MFAGASNWHILRAVFDRRRPYGYLLRNCAGGVLSGYLSGFGQSVFFVPTVNLFSYFYRFTPDCTMVAGLGIVLGMVSSSIAIRKHLKV